jgi:2-phospho-L-lactate guanylyltransferase
MPTVVVPFRGVEGKSRLGRLSRTARTALAHAMLADVVAASTAIGPTVVVGPEGTPAGAATLVLDPGGGLGAAVRAGLDAAVAAGGGPPYLVVNADLPCVKARDLFALAGAVPDDGLALAPAADGTTNALALPDAAHYAPLYGAASAARFRDHAEAQGIPAISCAIPNLSDDVDTLDDLSRIGLRAGPRTQAALGRALG